MPWDSRISGERLLRRQLVVASAATHFEEWQRHWSQRSHLRPGEGPSHTYYNLTERGRVTSRRSDRVRYLRSHEQLQGLQFWEDTYDVVYTGPPVEPDHWTQWSWHFSELCLSVQIFEIATKTLRTHYE
jgi:hypothetical protein